MPKSAWLELVSKQIEYYPPTYAQDGFIHLTKNPSLLLPVANHFYQDVPGAFNFLSAVVGWCPVNCAEVKTATLALLACCLSHPPSTHECWLAQFCPGEYIVLEIDESKLKSEVKYEAAAPVGEKETKQFGDSTADEVQVFPHLYGTIDHDAVIGELKVERSNTGEFLSIEGVWEEGESAFRAISYL
jgi:uncharacterized protein (DUF952 family)